jgi:hypothetical protein
MGTATAEEMCVHDTLEEVIGPRPRLLADVPPQRNDAPAGGQGGAAAPNQEAHLAIAAREKARCLPT